MPLKRRGRNRVRGCEAAPRGAQFCLRASRRAWQAHTFASVTWVPCCLPTGCSVYFWIRLARIRTRGPASITQRQAENPAASFSLNALAFRPAKSTNSGSVLSLPEPVPTHTAQQEAFERGLSEAASSQHSGLSPRSLGGWNMGIC